MVQATLLGRWSRRSIVEPASIRDRAANYYSRHTRRRVLSTGWGLLGWRDGWTRRVGFIGI